MIYKRRNGCECDSVCLEFLKTKIDLIQFHLLWHLVLPLKAESLLF